VSGKRQAEGTFLEWQLNCNTYEAASLSAVMRSYFLEHEAANGVTQFVFVGGSSAVPGRYCDPDSCLDLVATRQGIQGLVTRNLVGWLRPGGRVASFMRTQNAAVGALRRDTGQECGMGVSVGVGLGHGQPIKRSAEAYPVTASSLPTQPSSVRPLTAKDFH